MTKQFSDIFHVSSKWEHWECANCQVSIYLLVKYVFILRSSSKNVLAVNGAPRPVKVLKNLNPGVNFQWYFVGKDTGEIHCGSKLENGY